jgi:hypothetical protein
MITVRFATGFSVQYNDAKYVFRRERYSDIYKEKGGLWIAQAPNSALIEVVHPCRTYNAATEWAETKANAEVQLLQKKVASLARAINKLSKVGAR